MNDTRVQRRLAAILAADAVSYSKLMGQNEVGTHEALKAYRRELIDPKIVEHQGRLVKSTGDGVLVEFASVVNAVACATEIQREMGKRNAGIPPDRRLDFRIGINLGDVIVESDDIYGDGVNVAARIQSVAKPGGIAVSGAVRDHVANRLEVVFQDAGEQRLKNIDIPVRVYDLQLNVDKKLDIIESKSNDYRASPLSLPRPPQRQDRENSPRKRILTYTALRSAIFRRVLHYTFSGPLLLAWSSGVFIFIAVLDQPMFAAVWSAVSALLGLILTSDHLNSVNAHEQLFRSIFGKQFQYDKFNDPSLKRIVEKQVTVLSEVALKLFQIEKERGVDSDLRRLVPLGQDMVALLWNTAAEIEELERGLELAAGAPVEGSTLGRLTKKTAAIGDQRDSKEDIARQIEQARYFMDNIVYHLESLMLKVFQVAQLPKDSARNSELSREYEEVANKLRDAAQSRCADRYVSAELQQTRQLLETGFAQLNSSAGSTALRHLVMEYAQLQPILDRQRKPDLISMSHVPALVEESYRIGLSLLEDALELMQASSPGEKERLKGEVVAIKNKAAAVADDKSQEERLLLLNSLMNSHLERLHIMEKHELRTEQLLHLAGLCEASLHRTHMELAALQSADSETTVRQATNNLQQTIAQARDVQEELVKLGL
jgi:class 3 adenylate cyclase